MARWMDYSKKLHLGSVTWRETCDWKILQWGNIFSIPPEELKKYNWGEIGFGLSVEVPIIKSEYNYESKGQNTSSYYTVILDWEYLLERQANLFGSLGWGRSEIENFLTEQLDWLDRRSQELEKTQKEVSIREAAENMSKITGKSVEYWIQKIKDSNGKETPDKKEEKIECKKEPEIIYPKGIVKKMGNEFFIAVDGEEKGYWKIGTNEKYQTKIESLDLQECIGSEYHFEPDNETKPPKSRNAKGWVKSIVLKK